MKMQQGIMGSPLKKNKDQQNSSTHCVRWSSAEFLFFSRNPIGSNIESAEVHYTKPEDEFCPGIGLNTKFRRFSFSRSQVHNLCSGVPLKTNLHYPLVN